MQKLLTSFFVLLLTGTFAHGQADVLMNYRNSTTGTAQVSPSNPLPIGGGFVQSARIADISVTNTTQNEAFGVTANTARVCNSGATNTAYVALGGSTITVTSSNGFPITAGTCANLSAVGFTYIAAITASSTTTLQISLGSGIASLGGGGSSGGSTSPGGSDTQIQYNAAGSFGGVSGWTTNGTTTLTGDATAKWAIGGGGITPTNIFTLYSTTGVASLNALVSETVTNSQGWQLRGDTGGVTDLLNVNSGGLGTLLINQPLSFYLATTSTNTGGQWYATLANAPIVFGTGGNTLANERFRILGSAASFVWGGPDSATPGAITHSTQNVLTGTSNTAGIDTTYNASQGTGTGTGGSFVFKVAPAGSTGSTKNALATALTIDSTKLVSISGSAIVGAGSALTSTGPGGALASGAFTATGTSGATIPLLNGANTWSGVQTFTNSDIALLGSSTGKTTFTSANAGASNYTLTIPAITSTITTTIASGAKALATSAIASAACSSAQTDTATGTLTTDAIQASFSADPTAVTGYIPLTAGMLTIIVYPTADTVNFKVCNNTSSSITPGAITINWRVTR